MYSSVNVMRRDVSRRLRQSEYLILYGPFGSGKTTLLTELQDRLNKAGVRCARAPETCCLDDIVHALELLNPQVDARKDGQQSRHPDPEMAADRRSSVLLLDHLTGLSDAMVRFLRRVHRGAVGVLIAVDVEMEQKQQMRLWRLGGSVAVRMPPVGGKRLRDLLREGRGRHHLPPLTPEFETSLIRAASGRPGWILRCIDLERGGSYWQNEQLFVSQLSEDTEMALRRCAVNLLRQVSPFEKGTDDASVIAGASCQSDGSA